MAKIYAACRLWAVDFGGSGDTVIWEVAARIITLFRSFLLINQLKSQLVDANQQASLGEPTKSYVKVNKDSHIEFGRQELGSSSQGIQWTYSESIA